MMENFHSNMSNLTVIKSLVLKKIHTTIIPSMLLFSAGVFLRGYSETLMRPNNENVSQPLR